MAKEKKKPELPTDGRIAAPGSAVLGQPAATGDTEQGSATLDHLKSHPFFKDNVPQKVARSQIKPAPYNPRDIDLNAKVKLKQGLREFGCVEALVWNKRTGNLVGGHQRLKLADEEVNFPTETVDYGVPVMVVDLDDADEKMLNVLLNNPGAQGFFDWQPLKSVMASNKEFDAEKAGFDTVLLKSYFDQFTPADDGLDLSHIFGDEKADPAQADAEAIAKMKATKEDYKAAEGEYAKDGFYVQVIGRTVGEKEKFCEALGLSTYTKSVELRDLVIRLNDLIARGKPIDIGWTPPPDPVTAERPTVGVSDPVASPSSDPE